MPPAGCPPTFIGVWPALLLILLVLPFAFIALPAVAILFHGRRRCEEAADVAIVLGARVWGEEPAPVFRERIHHGIGLYRRGLVGRVLLTGGRTRGGTIAESEAARRYAEAVGLPAEAILLETESQTTFQNMVHARRVMEECGLRTALIVSDPIHMLRAMLMAKANGINARPAPTPTTRFITWRKKGLFLFREVCSLYSYLWLRY